MSLTDSQMLEIFDREVRRECEWTRMQREALPDIVRYTEMDSPDGGYISWSALTPETADERIQEQIAHYLSLKMEFEWKTYSYDTPADLPQRLLKHGFSAGDPEALMLAGMDDLPESYWTMDATAVTRITTPEGVDEIVLMESEVWGEEKSGFSRGMKFDLVHNPDHLSVFAVRQNDRVVSAAWTHYLVGTSFATLWGGSTLADYRNRGYYTSLLAVRAREARSRKYKFLQVDASPNSQPILAKHGFRNLAYTTPYTWKPDR